MMRVMTASSVTAAGMAGVGRADAGVAGGRVAGGRPYGCVQTWARPPLSAPPGAPRRIV